MTKEPELSGREKRELASDSSSTAGWTLGLMTALIMSGLTLSLALKPLVSGFFPAAAANTTSGADHPGLPSPDARTSGQGQP